MPAIQITLDYLEELRSIDPNATISVTIWSKVMEIGEEGARPIMHGDVRIINKCAFTLDSSMWLHITSADHTTDEDASSDAPAQPQSEPPLP